MAGKKVKYRSKPKKFDVINLKPSDIICPICRTVLIEPVSLPCDHVFCKLCFDGTMENANLVCPLCRIRVGSWYRRAKKEGILIDEVLWDALKLQYPIEVQNKYKGIDNAIEQDKPIILVSNPGEIRKEFEIEKQKQEEELRKIHDAEEKASAALIKQLKEEEEYRKQLEQEKIRLDEEFARKISKELMPSTSKFTKDLVKKRLGPLDKFLQNKNSKLFKFPQNNEESFNDSMTSRTPHNASKTGSPNNLATKPYTCQVLCIDSNSTNKVSYLDVTSSMGSKIKKKVHQSYNSDVSEIKNLCQSECGSNGSRENSDVIDQECKFYFKPIDLYKKYHVQGHLPVKIPCKKDMSIQLTQIIPPSGVVANLWSGHTSAFANLSILIHENVKRAEKTNEVLSNISRKRKYNEESLIDVYSNDDSSDFYGFTSIDISKSVRYCDNALKICSKIERCFFKKKFKEITEHRKKYNDKHCSQYHSAPSKVFKDKSNKSEKSSVNFNHNFFISDNIHNIDVSPILTRNSLKNVTTDAFLNIENSVNLQNNLFRSSDHKILVYDDKPKNAEQVRTETSPISILSPIKVKSFYNSKLKNITTSKIPNKPTENLQDVKINSDNRHIQKSKNIHAYINTIPIKVNNDTRKIKGSPKKIKLTTNTSNIQNKTFENIVSLEQRKLQEESDFELAKKMQAEFDSIHIPSRTRRGTTRQITLDEMLLI